MNDAEIALNNAQRRYPIDDLSRPLTDLRHHRQSIFSMPPARITDDTKFATNNPDHPCAETNRFRRQRAADFFKLLATGQPSSFSTAVLAELHESLFDRDPAVRMTVAETLGILRRPESLPHLHRLLESEDESAWVRNTTKAAIDRCSTI